MKTSSNKKINRENVLTQLEKLGFSQASVAESLGVSKQSVSNWFLGSKFPRPGVLLKLAKILQLSFDEIVIKEDISMEPVVAFRKKGKHKITPEYIEDAKDKGFLLEKLVPYLPYDKLSKPPTLIDPKIDYKYIQTAAAEVRKVISKKDNFKINFQDLIDFFNQHHAVIIPVLWGDKKNHENALHIYLPKSRTTWIYLNIDSRIHDFKFWMAHELGHVKAPDLPHEDAEDFADQFAGALLVPEQMAKDEYNYLRKLTNIHHQTARIKEKAEELTIAPLSIYYEIKRYAEFTNKPIIDLEKNRTIYKVNTEFCKKYKRLSGHLFDTLPPSASDYIDSAKNIFNSSFFDALKILMSEQKKSIGYLQALLNLPTPDAHALFEGLHI